MPDPSAPRRDPGGRWPGSARAPWIPIAVGVLLLVAVGVIASGTNPSRRGSASGTDVVVVALAAVVAAVSVGLAVTAWLRRDATRAPRPTDDTDSVYRILRRQRLAASAITLILLGLAVGLVASYLARGQPPVGEPFPRATAPSTTTAPLLAEPESGSTSDTWRLLLAGGLAVVAVATAVVATRRRVAGRDAGRATTEVTDALAVAIADLDDLADDADNRRVVVRCYARMERAAALGGVPTDATDTPTDLVSRLVADRDADPAACQRLRDLFEHARFSTHPVDDAMRAEAAHALRAVRAALLGSGSPVRTGESP